MGGGEESEEKFHITSPAAVDGPVFINQPAGRQGSHAIPRCQPQVKSTFFFLFFPFSFVILSFFLAFSLGGGQEFPSNALSIQGPRPVTRVTGAPPGPLDIPKTPLRTRRSAFRAPRVPRGLATHSPPACFHSAVAFLPL